MTDNTSPVAGVSQWTPEFPGQRPPFQRGHELSVQHGCYSPRRVDPLASELVDRMLSDVAVTFLQAPAYRPALWAWARAEAKCQLLEEYLDGRDDLADERVIAAYRELHRAETRAANLRTQLGLTPLARARLGKDVAQARVADAAAVMAELHRLEERGAIAPPEGTRGRQGASGAATVPEDVSTDPSAPEAQE